MFRPWAPQYVGVDSAFLLIRLLSVNEGLGLPAQGSFVQVLFLRMVVR